MNSRFGGMCRSRELGSQDISLICFFQINKKIDFCVGDMSFHILDGIPLRKHIKPTM